MLCSSALARATAPVSVRPLSPRLQWGMYADMNTLELDPQFHIKQIPCFCCHMAMTTPHHQRRQWYWYGFQLEMTHFMRPYRHETITKTCYNTQQNDQLKWLPIVVAIATDHVFTSNTESPCFCCYWQHLTTNGAGIRLQLIHFCYLQVSILWGMWQ